MIEFTQCNCRVHKGKFNINEIPLDCPAVWKMIATGHTAGVFQLEKKLGQDWAQKVRPRNIEELASLVSLLRPGPLESGMSEDYVKIKSGKQLPDYLHQKLKPILEPTYGCLVFQEQALRIATDLAGFSPEMADELRKAIGKKLPELMAKIKDKFVKGCIQYSQIDKNVAEEIFGWIEKCQRYSFNKCFSGDTIIRKNAKGRFLKQDGYSIKHMYRIKNDLEYAKQHGHSSLRKKWNTLGSYGYGLSLCEDGRIRSNVIRDIQPSGKKQLYLVCFDNGSSIRVTKNHKFPTPDGENKLEDLSVGDEIFVCGEYEQTDFCEINKYSTENNNHKHRPYGKARCGFPTGEDNPAYTNGSFTDFKKYKNSKPDICEKCGKSNCRIEISHLNGNRLDSSSENLMKMCVSCHKKHDYGLGRTKRLEKGYPSHRCRIKSITRDKIEETWDVTMDHPNHTLVVNSDVVVSNSHAVAYGLIGYQTAWLKTHFPLEFFCSYLTYSNYKGDPKEEIYKLVQDARLFNVEILPPDIRKGNTHFKIVNHNQNKAIAFGLSHIRGVGESAIAKIINDNSSQVDQEERSFVNSWPEFLYAVPDFHRNVGIALIKSGACDCFNMPRSEMVRELEVVLGTTTRDSSGKKIEIKGLTAREKEYFFDKLINTDMTTKDILLEMSTIEPSKDKTLSQMSKPELIDKVRSVLRPIAEDTMSLVDGDSQILFDGDYEVNVWFESLPKKTKKVLVDLIKDNGYKDQTKKPPCANGARRQSMAEKAKLLEEDLEDTNTTNAVAEKYFLGIAISCSQADDADNSRATHTCLDLAKCQNKENIIVCVIIDSVKHTKTKRGRNPGQPMCFLTISDSTYSIDHAVVFPDVFQDLKGLCKEDVICLVQGKKQNGSFIVENMKKLI